MPRKRKTTRKAQKETESPHAKRAKKRKPASIEVSELSILGPLIRNSGELNPVTLFKRSKFVTLRIKCRMHWFKWYNKTLIALGNWNHWKRLPRPVPSRCAITQLFHWKFHLFSALLQLYQAADFYIATSARILTHSLLLARILTCSRSLALT